MGRRYRRFSKIETAILSEDAAALSLCEELMDFPETIRRAADERAVHLIAAYLRRLAALTHGFYEKNRRFEIIGR